MGLATHGYMTFAPEARVAAWSQAAHRVGMGVAKDPAMRAQWLRHGGTWFVGVDALPNGRDGSIDAVPLAGPWEGVIDAPQHWHRAQLSVIYPGYPRQDSESDAAFRYRTGRCAAHVDGLLLEDGRRYPREPHAFILGIALNDSAACPLMVWPRSHLTMRAALAGVIGVRDPRTVDVTEAYVTARKAVFSASTPVALPLRAGASVLLDRHLLHGIAPWKAGDTVPSEGRMMAYFRPICPDPVDWLRG